MQLYCPQCAHPLAHGATRCPACPAEFTDPQGWQPVSADGLRTDKAKDFMRIAAVLGIFYLLPIVGLFISYRVGNPNLGFLFGVYLMLAVPIGIIGVIAAQIAAKNTK